MVDVQGTVDAGYGVVMDVFAANFRDRRDLGAACTAYVGGRKVVDLWGGTADRRSGQAWTADTAAVTFSCTKGLVAICAYLLVQDGRLDLDAPVTRYWPEFGQAGKADIRVRSLLSHRAGLSALDRDLTLDDVVGWDPVIRAIETQAPLWPPETAYEYHAMTYGWLIGEVIRRITGLTPGPFFDRALAGPLGLKAWIGLPDAERGTVAWMEPPLAVEPDASTSADPEPSPNDIVLRGNTMGGAFAFPADADGVTFNDPRIQGAEIAGANGIATARSLARLYAGCASEIDGPRLLSRASIDDAIRCLSEGRSRFGPEGPTSRWGSGFQISSPETQPMLGERSFGHAGAGGQLAFGDDRFAVGFAYLSNQMGAPGDLRARLLSEALASCLER